jgi:hypoxanthine phosphoribosyltransferase
MAGRLECVFDAAEIRDRVGQLAAGIRERWPDGELALLGILKGAALFVADLARDLGEGVELTFVQARSYGKSTVSSGEVILGDFEDEALRGRRVVVADTILDTGLTLSRVVAQVRERGADDVLTCVLVDKPARRVAEVTPDLVGFTVPDRFLVGYGLDHAGRYRGLPYLAVLGESTGE